uniref:Putative secreted peptide n=1 Tax=Anopheles braziliensis TaxID=58242 RepID=A0A2M3ZPE7_9DIPT
MLLIMPIPLCTLKLVAPGPVPSLVTIPADSWPRCCNATSPRQMTCATSICVGHSPVAIAPNTPHSCVNPLLTAPRPARLLTIDVVVAPDAVVVDPFSIAAASVLVIGGRIRS